MANIRHVDDAVMWRSVVAGCHDSRIGMTACVAGGALGFRDAALVARSGRPALK